MSNGKKENGLQPESKAGKKETAKRDRMARRLRENLKKRRHQTKTRSEDR